MPHKNPPRVSVHHEYWMISGIEQDGIGSLRPNPIQLKEFFSNSLLWAAKIIVQRAAVALIEKVNESFQPLSLLTEISRGPDQALQFSQGHIADALYAEQSGRAKIRQSLFHIRPRRILRQISAHDHFEA